MDNKPKHIDLIDEDSLIRFQRNLEIEMDQELCKIQEKLELENTTIYFPHKPYDVQLQYMKSVIQTLDKKCNGLLESPTGTGKTLCLLCSTMGWLQKHRQEQLKSVDNKNLKIIYASRTHAQLKQVAQELKRTVYRPNISMIGSRDQYCLMNSKNYQGNTLIQLCRNLVKSKKCTFYDKEYIQTIATKNSQLINSLEESKLFGHTNKVCPYYFERERLMNADLILLPYNYLLDDEFSKIVDINNSIIIFDEAHNVPSTAENGQSFFINDNIVQEAKKELERWIEQLTEMTDFFSGFQQALNQKSLSLMNLNEYKEIAQTIGAFSMFLKSLQTASYFQPGQFNEQCKVFESEQILSFLFENTSNNKQNKATLFSNGISKDNISQYISFCQAIINYMCEVSPLEGTNFQSWSRFVVNLYNFMQDDDIEDNKDHQLKQSDYYKLAIIKNKQDEISLNMWCLDPSLAFKKLMQKNIHSIILTSGTLSPMESWKNELSIEFQIQLSNRHVIDIANNVRAFQHLHYDFSWGNRGDDNQIKNLGLTILTFSQIIKGGIIVVFSSYGLMENIKKKWHNQQLIQQFNKVKKCLWEEQGSASFHNTLEVFKQNVKGAILFAVHRGKVAEGIDLSDDLCRAVFLVGIPYPPLEDQKIKLKKAYLEKLLQKNRQGLSSNDWYNQQAIRATNQAIGRVIRHINDYGAIFLCDKRFKWSNMMTGISRWVQPAIKPWKTDNDLIQNLTEFFQRQNLQKNELNPQNQQKDQLSNQQQSRNQVKETQKQIEQQIKEPSKIQSIDIVKCNQQQVQVQQKPKIILKGNNKNEQKSLQPLITFSHQKQEIFSEDSQEVQEQEQSSDFEEESQQESDFEEESQQESENEEESQQQFKSKEESQMQNDHQEDSFEYSENYTESSEEQEFYERSSDDSIDRKQKKRKDDYTNYRLYKKRKYILK